MEPMDVTVEEQAHRTYATLIDHLDHCVECASAEGSASLMCEHGHLLALCWEVAECQANQLPSVIGRPARIPFLDADITTVTWDQVKAFPTEVAYIKPTKSPVFTSKLRHFLHPKIFPVVDNAGMGNKWPSYESYFKAAQDLWAATGVPVRV